MHKEERPYVKAVHFLAHSGRNFVKVSLVLRHFNLPLWRRGKGQRSAQARQDIDGRNDEQSYGEVKIEFCKSEIKHLILLKEIAMCYS